MTLATTHNRREYTGNGSTTVFAYNFLVQATADLQVYNAGVLQTETTHYSVSGAGSASGGNVTFVTAPLLAAAVLILRATPLTQNISFPAGGAFPAASNEEGHDRATAIHQDRAEEMGRAVKLPKSSTLEDIDFPVPGAAQVIRWNSAGDGLESVTVATAAELAVITAKGDISQGDAAGDAARLARGAAGSILYIATDLLAYLAIGSGNQVLSVSGGNPVWAAPEVETSDLSVYALTSAVTSTLTAYAQLAVAQEFTRTQNFNATTLTDGATIAWDCALNQVCSVTLGGNRAMGSPSNVVDGSTYILIVKQPASGGPHTLSYASEYKWPEDAAPVLSTTANYVDLLSFVADGSNLLGVFNLDLR